MNELGEFIKKKRLLPSLTLFYGRTSSTYRNEIIRFLSYLFKESKKYQQIESQRDNGGHDVFMEVMADLNLDMDHDVQLPDLSQLSQVQQSFGNFYDREANLTFDQAIDTEIPRRQENYILNELRDELMQTNPAMEDYDYPGSNSFAMADAIKIEPGNTFEDYGNVELNMQRNPEDFRTPIDPFQRAARKLQSVETNLRMYNMKQDLKQTFMKTNSEYFGPDSIAAKERMPRLKKILDLKQGTAKKEKPKITSAFDFSIAEEETFDAEFFKSIMGDKKKSRVRIVENENIDEIEQRCVLPQEEVYSIDDFNSLFTRNIKEFDLEKEMALKIEIESEKGTGDDAYRRPSVDFEAGGGPEQFDQGYGNNDMGFGGDYFDQEGQGGKFQDRPRGSGPADMTGMNLLNNYFNVKEDDKILSLERKLAQTSNFKITDFKKHVNEKYILILEKLKRVNLAYIE